MAKMEPLEIEEENSFVENGGANNTDSETPITPPEKPEKPVFRGEESEF